MPLITYIRTCQMSHPADGRLTVKTVNRFGNGATTVFGVKEDDDVFWTI